MDIAALERGTLKEAPEDPGGAAAAGNGMTTV